MTRRRVTARPRFYLGLAATLHDPALAVVDASGKVLFAEAAERPLQDKRAFNAPPDPILRTAGLLREHCGEDAELVVALNWSRGFAHRLELGALVELPGLAPLLSPLVDRILGRRDPLVWPLPGFKALTRAMRGSLHQASHNLAWSDGAPLVGRVRRFDHHLAHAAAACFGSPFEEAVCAIVDGFGEWTSASFYHYREGALRRLVRAGALGSWRRGSLGMFYGLLCRLCGFDPLRGEEWKVMGLAPYGQVDPELHSLLSSLLEVRDLELLAGCPPRQYRARLAALRRWQRPPGTDPLAAADLARTGQEVFCEVMRRLLVNLHRRGLSENLALGGGCALNSAWNGRLLDETPFRELYVPSAPADDGTAVGAALLAWRQDHPGQPIPPGPQDPFLGSRPSPGALERLGRYGGRLLVERPEEGVERRAARLLAAGEIVGWMQGRAELGPRALGHRSILADPRRADMKERINARVKGREAFRPFAPSILDEHGAAYFAGYRPSWYMERALPWRAERRAEVPAVVHVDGTGRLQSVTARWCGPFHGLIEEFHALTGVPLLLNTSLNVMGKPIVHSVEDAVGMFCTTGLDALVIEDLLLRKDGGG